VRLFLILDLFLIFLLKGYFREGLCEVHPNCFCMCKFAIVAKYPWRAYAKCLLNRFAIFHCCEILEQLVVGFYMCGLSVIAKSLICHSHMGLGARLVFALISVAYV
jgi:hypothetical protein